MYAIVYHHDYDEVLLGPVEWKPRFIASVIQQDLDLPNMPSISVADEANVPYQIYPDVWAYKINTVYPEINTKTQRVDGPFWTFTDQVATATYTAADKSIDQVKAELKNLVAAKRYELENAGTTVTVQGVIVPVSTSRTDRAIYTTAVAGPWKFTDGTWLTLTQEDLNTIVSAIQTYVSDAFTWEQTLCATIDAATDLSTLNSIEI
jgi:hypothetical protein